MISRRPLTSILLRYLTKEITLIHRKGDVNLEWLTLRHLQSLFVCNNQIVGSGIAVFQQFQIKLATESTLCAIITCLIRNNLLDITDLEPVRNVRRQAHKKKNLPMKIRFNT